MKPGSTKRLPPKRATNLLVTSHSPLATGSEPEVLKIIAKEAKRAGKSDLTSRQIDQVIKATRAEKR